jgi:1,4-alpha-glucan branching enzyme
MLKRFYMMGALVLLAAGMARGQSFPAEMGATPYAGSMGTGTTFRVWAGSATSVVVVGTFNNWSESANPLTREGASEVWSANVAGARPGQQFHYLINGQHRRRDPRSARIVKHDIADSIIYDQNAYDWKSEGFVPPPLAEMVIYELHVGTFNDPHPEAGGSASLDDARQKLDYVASIGANAVKIMPVTEFPGSHSWGYNPTDLYAVDNLIYGGPDALKRFVDDAHQRGIAVILDIVHNHYSDAEAGNNMRYSLWNFDGLPGSLGGGMYFYQDPVKAQTRWGPRPNYNNTNVRDYIKDNVRMWLRDYRIDGFRWDATKFIRQATNDAAIVEGETLLREVNTIIRNEFTNKFSIAEDLAQLASTTAPTNTGGLGFHSDWHTEVHFALVQEIARTNATPDFNRILSGSALNYSSHTRRVVYTESHDEVGQKNFKDRVPYRMDPANPTGELARRKSMLAAGLMFGTPGIPMIFQGQEMLETIPFEDTNSVRWALIDQFPGVHNFYKDMMHLRRNYFGNTGGLTGQFVFAQMQTLSDSTNQVLTMHRLHQGGVGDDVFIVANLSGQTHTGQWITFPATGEWYAVLNSDSTKYGADFSGVGLEQTATFGDRRGIIDLAPWSFIIYARSPLPASTYTGMAVAGPFNGWNNNANMNRWQEHVWSVDLELAATPVFEFKLVANADWDIAWGMGSVETNEWPLKGNGNDTEGSPNFFIPIPADGTYRFTFNSATGAFEVREIKSIPLKTKHPNMALAAGFNEFNLAPNLGLNADGVWTGSFSVVSPFDLHFKFAAYGIWDVSWGGWGNAQALPLASFATPNPPGDIVVQGPLNGTYVFSFNDVTTAYTLEKTGAPDPYPNMQIIGSFNGWSGFEQMQSAGTHQWQYTVELDQAWDLEFRVAAYNTGYNFSWSSTNAVSAPFPATASATLGGSGNFAVRGPLKGIYTITFNSADWTYTVTRSASSAYPHMTLAGNFNGFDPAANNMTSNGLHQWSYTANISRFDAAEFKFASGSWDTSWSRNVSHPPVFPINGSVLSGVGENIFIAGPLDGAYTFTFDSDALTYTIDRTAAAPPARASMAVAGTLNSWNKVPNMTLNANNEWVYVRTLNQSGGIQFKFVAEDNWDISWGHLNAGHTTNAPVSGAVDTQADNNIILPGPFSGDYRFVFNDRLLTYRVERVAVIDEPFEVMPVSMSGNQMVFQWQSHPGATYTIERSTNLMLPNNGFSLYVPAIPAVAVMNVFTMTTGQAETEFYRISGQ